jgi:hypothetical protein
MKSMNKIMLFLFTCLTLVSVTNCLFYNDGGYPSGALSGAAIGGLAGGRKGAAIGLGVGAATDIMGAAARSDRRRYDDGYESRSSRRYRKKQQRLEDENAALRARLQQYENGRY